ncbi:MAG TPA: arginine--tRNA ligase, partial [Candidatus Nitrosopolaris sp.]|nr:arginine--tRNA ligase [Candidatus Nitrosopolaris sp.]
MQEIARALKDACQKLFNTEINPELSRPEEQFGDFATNAALQLGQKLGKNPREIAMALAGQLHGVAGVADVQIAGPGFINLKLTDEALAKTAFAATDLPKPLAGQQILVEFGDPNPFKEMHIGHLYSYIVGDAIASLLETAGAEVKRLSYHGDVGLHVAKAIWAMQRNGGSNIGQAYATGAKAYEEDQQAKDEIDGINQHVYQMDNPQINDLYSQGTQQSFAAFDKILDLLSISINKRYLETDSAKQGIEIVRQNTGKVF